MTQAPDIKSTGHRDWLWAVFGLLVAYGSVRGLSWTLGAELEHPCESPTWRVTLVSLALTLAGGAGMVGFVLLSLRDRGEPAPSRWRWLVLVASLVPLVCAAIAVLAPIGMLCGE